MDTNHDTISGAPARNTDRRSMLRLGLGASGAAAVAALASRTRTHAQEASPVPVDELVEVPFQVASADVETLFVQAFQRGNWEPGPEAGTYTLILHGGLAATIYFSDRPARVYGAMPTEGFIETLGFSPDNPANAALVVNSDGVADILVIELMDPVYDDGAQNLTYTARVLEAYHETGLEYLAVQQEDQSIPQEFGAGALFIDDCADRKGYCFLGGPGTVYFEVVHEGWYGYCLDYVYCWPCRDYAIECNRDIPECQGKCNWLPYPNQ